MAFMPSDRQLLAGIHDHLRNLERMLIIMAQGMDRLIAAVENNAVATDALSDEVMEAIDWIKNHADNDPALMALATKLEEKNAKALQAKQDLDAATAVVSASGGPATP